MHRFNATDGGGREEDIAADAADLGRSVVDYDHLTMVFDGVNDPPGFVFPRASLNGALPGALLRFRGVTHLGALGS
jgi:hypothetical protein